MWAQTSIANSALAVLLAITCSTVIAQDVTPESTATAPSSSATPDPAGENAPEATIDFGRDIAPILSSHCVACHNAKKPEGGLNLEDHDSLLRGGDSGASVLANQPADSYLLARITGEEEPLMPPEDNAVGAKRLSDLQIEQFRQWILQGARPPEPQTAPLQFHWQALPGHVQPIYALAASSDGHYLAFGRGSSVVVAPPTALEDLSRHQTLVDPGLLPDKSASSPTAHLDTAHQDLVQSVAFSPDGQLIATGGYRTVKLWRRHTGVDELLDGLSPAGQVTAISPDGQRIAYATGQHGLELVDVATGQAHRFLKLHRAPLTAAIWLADQRWLLSSDASGQWWRTDAVSHRSQSIELSEPLVVTSLAGLGDRVFAIDDQGRIAELRWEGAESESALSGRVRFVPGPSDLVSLTTVAGETPRLIVATRSGVVHILDPESGNTFHRIDTGTPIQDLDVRSDGSQLLTVHEDGLAKIWQVQDGQLVAALDRDYFHSQQLGRAQRDVVRQQGAIAKLAAKVPDLQKASEKEAEAQKKVQETRDKAAEALAQRAQEVETARQGVTDAEQTVAGAQAALAQAQKHVEAMNQQLENRRKAVADAQSKHKAAEKELAKRDQALAAASDSARRAAGEIPRLESLIAQEKQRLGDLEMHQTSLQETSLAAATMARFSTDGTQALVAGQDRVLRAYASADGSPLANFADTSSPMQAVSAIARHLVGLTIDGRLLRWDLRFPWKLERTLGSVEQSPFSDRVTALDFSPDGSRLAVGSGPPSRFGDVVVVSTVDGSLISDLGQVHSDSVLAVRFSPGGRRLATAGADKLCRLLDVGSGAMLRVLEGHTHHVLGIAWKDDGQVLATASSDGSVKLWNTDTGETRRTLGGFRKELTALQFVGATPQLVTACADGQVRLHNTDDGKQLRAFQGTSGTLYNLALSPDGQRVSSGGQAGSVWTWQLADATLLSTFPPAK